jgi:pimeloyl-ACP methyl ester carboxylesterase
MYMKSIFLISSIVMLSACSNDDRSSDSGFELAPLQWQDCSDTATAECGMAELPLFYDDSEDDRKISIAVRRMPAVNESTAQLWLLAGGPGQSGIVSFAANMELIREQVRELDNFDLYTLDHRGVGDSYFLGCPDLQDRPACLAHIDAYYGDRLQGITTTASARDVGELIRATSQDDQQVFVLGVSYGTYLAQRYVQLFPTQADGIILDSIVPVDADASTWNAAYNAASKKFFDACAKDQVCVTKLGKDPWEFLGELERKLDNGHCPDININSDILKIGVSAAIRSNVLREVIAPAIYRIDRCNDNDINVLNNNFLPSLQAVEQRPVSDSLLLNIHVLLSEMWNYDNIPSASELTAAYDAAYVGTPATIDLGGLYDIWPRYQRDEYDDQLMNYTGPLLMLQGGFDPAATLEAVADYAEIYNGENQTFALFPFSTHNIIAGTPDTEGGGCGQDLVIQFLTKPYGSVDLSCIEQVVQIRFASTPAISFAAFGTFDAWGDG